MTKPALVTSAGSLITNSNSVEFEYGSIEEAFPVVDPGLKPFGAIVLVQVRHPKRKSKGDIILSDESRSNEHYNTQVAKVIAMGPLVFKTVKEIPAAIGQLPRDVLVDYVEGAWFKIGDFVRIPKHGGDRFSVPYTFVEYVDGEKGRKEKNTVKDELVFINFKAKDIIGLIEGDPLKVKAFLET